MKTTISCRINKGPTVNVNLHICEGCFVGEQLLNVHLLNEVKLAVERDLDIVNADDLQKNKRKDHILQGKTVYVSCIGGKKLTVVVTTNSKVCQEIEKDYYLPDDYGTIHIPVKLR